MMQTTRNQLVAAAIGMASLAGVSTSQASDKLSGSISLDMNSHFISYGLDVWGGGDDPRHTFNPSVSIDYAICDNWTISTGFWLDVNSNASQHVETVETDIWIGATYTSGIYSVGATFQNWQYGGTSEEILDVAFAIDTFLSPSLTWHKRLGAGASGGFEGSFLVLGLEHGFDLSDSFSVSVPFALGYAVDDFHTNESGYGYTSIGLQASYAIDDQYSFNFGATYYFTDDDVIPQNPEEDFLTYNAGISYTF